MEGFIPEKISAAFLLLLFFGGSIVQSQTRHTKAQYQIRTIAFYNLENLFDTINDPHTFDQDRTPNGKDLWTSKKFNHKINQLAKVIRGLGVPQPKTSLNLVQKNTVTTVGADLIGLCEVENIQVIETLISHELLVPLNYGIIHFDSPDERGIDVALLYKKDVFIPAQFNRHALYLFTQMQMRNYTRDQLVVMGYLDGEAFWLLINHWPSRSGGEARSKPFRTAAALLNLKIIDSIREINPAAKIISMGDFNDDPTDDSFKKILQTKAKIKDSSYKKLFNPMEALFKKGVGSLAYRDQWSLFDQFYLSESILRKEIGYYTYLGVQVYNKNYLTTQTGRYKGYPYRSYSGGSYQGGYSDHFPIQLFLIRKNL